MNALVRPAMIHDAETGTTTKKEETRLDVDEMKLCDRCDERDEKSIRKSSRN